MVELDGAGVLEHVAPPEIRAVGLTRIVVVPELGGRRREAKAHHGELVVDEACIETGNESAGERGGEDEDGEAGDGAAEGREGGVLQSRDHLKSTGGVSEQTAGAEDGEGRDEHPGVAQNGGSEMGGKAVLRDTGVGAGREEVIL